MVIYYIGHVYLRPYVYYFWRASQIKLGPSYYVRALVSAISIQIWQCMHKYTFSIYDPTYFVQNM